jgi:hypothetical protein
MMHGLFQNKRSYAEFSNQTVEFKGKSEQELLNRPNDCNLNSITFDEEAFEPIPIVTPSKKRAVMTSNVDSNNYIMEPQKRRNSLEFMKSLLEPPLNSFQNNTTSSLLDPIPITLAPGSLNNGVSSSLSMLTEPKEASPSTSCLVDSTLLGLTTNKIEDTFEPLFVDTITQPLSAGSIVSASSGESCTDHYPKLCASSSSSIVDDQDIIQPSNGTFRMVSCTTAEVEPSNDFAILDMIPAGGCTYTPDRSSSCSNNEGTIINTCCSPLEDTTLVPMNNSNDTTGSRFKPFHEEKWVFLFDELVKFKKDHGHCLVPHKYPQNPQLARWVKRQRRQYKLKLKGNKTSTMTDDRIKSLNDIGFVWDSHEIIWNERFNQLVAYKQTFGHCRVPSYSKEFPQLASWVKCQRRQYKMFCDDNKSSSITEDRIRLLNRIGFIWEVHPGRNT